MSIHETKDILKKLVSGRPEPRGLRHLAGMAPDTLESGLLYTFYEHLANEAIQVGENFLAYELATRGLEKAGKNPPLKLRQLQILALARSGALHRAGTLLENLEMNGAEDSETIGLLARTYRDFALGASNEAQRQAHFEKAYAMARNGYNTDRNYYNGVQAAQFALMSGHSEEAWQLATDLLEEHFFNRDVAPEDNKDPFWWFVTIAEAELILGNLPTAKIYYKRAMETGPDRTADIGATARVCRMLLAYITGNPTELDACFPLPPLAIFSGHMIDLPDREQPRFPPEKEADAAGMIRCYLEQAHVQIGFSSLACGSDILFAEAILAIGSELHLILPSSIQLTRQLSVEIAGSNWAARYDSIIKRATSVREMGFAKEEVDSMIYAYVNRLMIGFAILKAREMNVQIAPVVFWDGKPGPPGGTGDFVDYWRRRMVEPKVISAHLL